MCGVIFLHGKNGMDVKKELLSRFHKQKHRGTEGFGFVAVKDNVISAYERCETEDEMVEALRKVESPDAILFHHRIPTSTPNYAGTSHPFKISHPSFAYDYYVVHNGVITNTNVLQTEHLDDWGIAYKSRYSSVSGVSFPDQPQYNRATKYPGKHNDSESIAVELALFLEGKKQTIDSIGGSAIIGLQVIKDTNEIESVFYGHNEGRPMVWEQESNKKRKKNKPFAFALKSEGDGFVLPSNSLYVRDYKTGKEIAYKISVGIYSQPQKATMGYAASYELPAKKEKSMLDHIFGDDAEYEYEKVQELESDLEGMKIEVAEWQAELAVETDLAVRTQIRKAIIEMDAEIKKIETKIDNYYFNYSSDYYSR